MLCDRVQGLVSVLYVLFGLHIYHCLHSTQPGLVEVLKIDEEMTSRVFVSLAFRFMALLFPKVEFVFILLQENGEPLEFFTDPPLSSRHPIPDPPSRPR